MTMGSLLMAASDLVENTIITALARPGARGQGVAAGETRRHGGRDEALGAGGSGRERLADGLRDQLAAVLAGAFGVENG
jgi:hypothetical protein